MKKKKIDQGYLHEAMDRTIIIATNLEDYVIKGRSCKQVPKAKKHIEKALDSLYKAYQEFGQHMK